MGSAALAASGALFFEPGGIMRESADSEIITGEKSPYQYVRKE
jgi:hypothetical protein